MNSRARITAAAVLFSFVVTCTSCRRDAPNVDPATETPAYERFDQTVAHIEQGEDGAAAEILEDLSVIGHTEASALLAALILEERIEEPEERAIRLLMAAASRGNIRAHKILSRYYGDSGAAHYDPERQLQHLRAGARYGDDESALALATLLSKSESREGLVEGMYWTRIGFARREPQFMMLLGEMSSLPNTIEIYDEAERLMRTSAVSPIVQDGRLVVPSRSWRFRWLIEGMSLVRNGQQDPDRPFFRPLETKPGEPDGVGPADFIRDLNSSMPVGRSFLLSPEGKESKETNVSLNEGALWTAVSQMDVVLLSDKITHHWATVWDVNFDSERIYFFEEYPEQFFLTEGKNASGIKAKSHELADGKVAHSISRKEFASVCQAVITFRHLDSGDPSQEAERALLDANTFILSGLTGDDSRSGSQ